MKKTSNSENVPSNRKINEIDRNLTTFDDKIKL